MPQLVACGTWHVTSQYFAEDNRTNRSSAQLQLQQIIRCILMAKWRLAPHSSVAKDARQAQHHSRSREGRGIGGIGGGSRAADLLQMKRKILFVCSQSSPSPLPALESLSEKLFHRFFPAPSPSLPLPSSYATKNCNIKANAE